jgi:hypothetical protein
MVPKMLTKK